MTHKLWPHRLKILRKLKNRCLWWAAASKTQFCKLVACPICNDDFYNCMLVTQTWCQRLRNQVRIVTGSVTLGYGNCHILFFHLPRILKLWVIPGPVGRLCPRWPDKYLNQDIVDCGLRWPVSSGLLVMKEHLLDFSKVFPYHNFRAVDLSD